jgi:hypothetical protein
MVPSTPAHRENLGDAFSRIYIGMKDGASAAVSEQLAQIGDRSTQALAAYLLQLHANAADPNK